MLKASDRQLPACVSKVPARATKGTNEQKSKNEFRFLDPAEISACIPDARYQHFIIYPTAKGWCFAMFYRSEKTDPFEIIGGSYEPFKLKEDCIKAMKKLMYGFGDTLMKSYIKAYDHKGNEISLKIEYDIKKLL